MTAYPHIRVKGSAGERGRQYGEAARQRIHLTRDLYERVFYEYTGWRWSAVTKHAERFVEPIRAYESRYLDEIEGIAQGAGLLWQDILAVNVRTEIMFAAKARAALDRPRAPSECSGFAALPSATATGHTSVGQNWDWLPGCFETVVVLEAEQDEAPNFVTIVEAGLLAKIGMNACGLGLATNALVTDRDVGAPGVPFHVLLRSILDAMSLTDALVALQRHPRSSSANYILASRDGLAVDIEAAPGDFSDLHLMFPDDGLILHTNHFLSPDQAGQDLSLYVMPDSAFRLERLRLEFQAAGRPLSAQTLRNLCCDHANYPLGICCHPDDRMPEWDQSATVASVIMDLDSRHLWLSDGYPCSMEYRELDYTELLASHEQSLAAAV